MMMTADPVQKVLVLRSLETQGNFMFRMAVLPGDEARQWEERLSKKESAPTPEITSKFGEPLTLSQVMEKLKTRDFAVLDYPGRQ
jgi:hypothetical protein